MFVLNNDAAVKKFTQSSFIALGHNICIALGPFGRSAEVIGAVGSKRMMAMFAYSKTRGVFGGRPFELEAVQVSILQPLLEHQTESTQLPTVWTVSMNSKNKNEQRFSFIASPMSHVLKGIVLDFSRIDPSMQSVGHLDDSFHS